jgi:hypothetical protein
MHLKFFLVNRPVMSKKIHKIYQKKKWEYRKRVAKRNNLHIIQKNINKNKAYHKTVNT